MMKLQMNLEHTVYGRPGGRCSLGINESQGVGSRSPSSGTFWCARSRANRARALSRFWSHMDFSKTTQCKLMLTRTWLSRLAIAVCVTGEDRVSVKHAVS